MTRVEDLVYPEWAAWQTGGTWSLDETPILRGLEPVSDPRVAVQGNVFIKLEEVASAMAESAALFVIHDEELAQIHWREPRGAEGLLPKLPFRRIAVERITEHGSHLSLIAELLQGREWLIFHVHPTGARYARFLRSNGGEWSWSYFGDWPAAEADSVRLFDIKLCAVAELLTARHVPTAEVTPSRAERRRFSRANDNGRVYPKLYFVNIAASGELTGEGAKLTVRFMVRGYYRKHGTEWVQGHVKGPAGAPWAGRAIHHRPVRRGYGSAHQRLRRAQ